MLKLFWGIYIFLMTTECMKYNYKNSNNLFNNHKTIKKQFFIKSRLPLDKIKDNHTYDIKPWTKLGIKRYTNRKHNEVYSFINDNNANLETENRKKKIIIANWKCYLLKEEAYKLIDKLTQIKFSNYIDVIVSPNLLFLPYLHEKIKQNNSKISPCSQDVSLVNGLGAFTGETTANLLHELGISYTIIGHSERKKGFFNVGENIEQTALKVYNAINSKLKVILCVGENYTSRECSFPFQRFRELLSLIKQKIPKEEIKNIIIAFEPRFAVGTGNPVSSSNLNSCCFDIRRAILDEIDENTSKCIKIVYGGSITKSNVQDYIENTLIDGFLIGKSSIDETFIDIIKHVDNSHHL
ncbi:triosephosphate isomerase, putative [Plasmodium chabaudi chabaudi]|uniref:Triosephosphate isomerase n=2 Tax=Plasmodium chabaudi TaxID=5825 RepID=A0A1D3RTN9_PLACU|nr:triosephosphate isomerase, putative [Plasmodium chabaudi adami]SCN59397.1 triosephosphate isomerase, putative [Plasmodium chabaudi chabaudi]